MIYIIIKKYYYFYRELPVNAFVTPERKYVAQI